ncbi:hypothetical protein D3C71_1491550 [compost metagenome]
MEKLRTVVGAEARTGAQADPVRAGGGLGNQVGIQLDADDARFEEGIQITLQLQLQRRGRDRHLFFRREQLVVQLLRDLDEVAGGIAGAGAIAGQRLLGRAEQLHRVTIHLGGAQRFEQAGGLVPAMRRALYVQADGMVGIALRADRGQPMAGIGEIELGVIDLRQHRLPAGDAGQEWRLQRGRPAGQSQQFDPAYRLDQLCVERGVVGDVTIHGHWRVHGRTVAKAIAGRPFRPGATARPCRRACARWPAAPGARPAWQRRQPLLLSA